jgi:Holliday junction resolvasome RuvABC endonuclease subunit
MVKIPVLGMDPSLRNWGLATAMLDLDGGYLDTPHLDLICPEDIEGKQVRQNSNDIHLAECLAKVVMPMARKAKVVFVECPVGSQSSRAMASYGVCVGILGAIRAEGIPLIEVTPKEVKVALAGIKTATKKQMIDKGVELYPKANWPTHNGKISAAKAEHVADAIAAIHAGVRTPTFQNLMRLFQCV